MRGTHLENPVGPDLRAGRLAIDPYRGEFDAATTRLPDDPPPEETQDAEGGVVRRRSTLKEFAPTILRPSVRGSSMSSWRRCRRMTDGPSALRQWSRLGAVAVVCLLLTAGCSGGEKGDSRNTPPPGKAGSPPPEGAESAVPAAPAPEPIRREFVILRELVRQHDKQTEEGNGQRVEAIGRNLRERLATEPDENLTDAEQSILEDARRILSEMAE